MLRKELVHEAKGKENLKNPTESDVSALKLHMNQKENLYIKAHEGNEKITSFMNTPTTLTKDDLENQKPKNETIYVNVENTSESIEIKSEQDPNQILIDPLTIPTHTIKNEENYNERITDPLDIPENQIQTEEDSSKQNLFNLVADQNNSRIPMDNSINSRILIENEKYSCKSCGKNIGENKLQSHERFCAK